MQSLKVQKFIDEYLQDHNGTQAAIRAGYSKRTARVTASKLLAKVNIRNEVNRRQEELARKSGITREWLVDKARKVLEHCMPGKGRKSNPAGAIKACYFLGDINGYMVTKTQTELSGMVQVVNHTIRFGDGKRDQ